MTARERAASASAAAAVERVQARTVQSFDPDMPEENPNTGGPITPPIAKAIRLEIEERRRG